MDLLLSALRVIGILFLVLMVFNLMILVHEWGHFLAARWRRLKVEAFQIWFGKPIWKKTINGVQYGLGCIPAGGFVKLPQMAPMGAIEGESENCEPLPAISPLDKIIVAFAGPLFSFLLACVFAILVWQFGKPESEASTTREIGYVFKDSPAEKAGLRRGDEILSIDGKPVKHFGGLIDSVLWLTVSSEGENIEFVVKRDGKEVPVSVSAEKPKEEPIGFVQALFRRPPLRDVGIMGRCTPLVGDVEHFSPAEEAGIRKNDLLISVDGTPLLSTGQLGEYIKEHPDKELTLELERKNTRQTVRITPRLPDKRSDEWGDRRLIGIVWDLDGKRELRKPGPSPISQVSDALRTMFETISKVFSHKSDIGPGHLSGPVGIVRVLYTLFESPFGWQLVLWFSVVLNINLAILNLLPFPVLDGGHITMALIEGVTRRPLSFRLLEIVQTACVLLLLGFLAFVTLKDTGDWTGGNAKPGKSAPKDPSLEHSWLPPSERKPAPAPAK
jgi:regulator of sigma E protease